MNTEIRRLFFVVLGLFFLLFAGTTNWAILKADEAKQNSLNRRPQLETARVQRGTIRASDGTLLARSTKQSDGTYVRQYTEAARQASQLIGWAYTNAGTSGMERAHHDDLTGKVRSVATLLSSLRGNREKGNDIVSTLSPSVQRAALKGMAGRKGAAMAIDTRTGGVLAMVSVPNFDPNDMNNPTTAGRVLNDSANSPVVNRVTQARYPPGSTFKVVTTAAALSTGRYTPQTLISGRSPMTVQGQPLGNFNGAQFGDITLAFALTHSVNTAFARVAEDIGTSPFDDAMDAFGFGKTPDIDYPDEQLALSGVRDRKSGQLLALNGDIDIARLAIGQERLEATPLSMALVAATIARRGDMPKLSTVDRVIDPDGRQLSSLGNGSSVGRAMPENEAADLAAMMEQVVREGTGTAASLPGVRVAGKTGSAERGSRGTETQPWFIGFAPADQPRVAVAVTLENVAGGQGGVDAAPIARSMFAAALK